ncbi:hypothetical protein RFI_01496 [Reticulomyxa filosa]|uniref:Uncharacterized protein n=1 Tax=Reticulomyxa filosa TaxID=46433 RepID=X6PBY2_RETFI|nr:hypothetical protein RFI_01496 [Reticulomyxa filosa]|eukprot:ETO35569.1 hypothetical protein RFI_01496 [Reticulomyxa filosa]
MYGSIGYEIGYGIDMTDTRNQQRQFKVMSNNDMDVETNGTRRMVIKRKTPDDLPIDLAFYMTSNCHSFCYLLCLVMMIFFYKKKLIINDNNLKILQDLKYRFKNISSG